MRVGVMGEHANAIAEDGAAGVGTGGVNGNDADRLILLTVVFGELVDQRALACSGCSGETQNASVTGVWKKTFQQVGAAGLAVFNGRDGAGKGARIARAQGLNGDWRG